MDKGEGGFREGTDQMDRFHRNEAISAVADEGFLGEEDDDYEDLYNDVNVGEGFLQSLRKGEELGFRNQEEKGESPPKVAPEQRGVSITGVGEGGGGASVPGFQNNQAFRDNEIKGTIVSGNGGIRVELGQKGMMSRMNEVEEQSRNSNSIFGVQGTVVGQQSHGGGAGNVGSAGNEGLVRQGGEGGGNVNEIGGNGVGNSGGVSGHGHHLQKANMGKPTWSKMPNMGSFNGFFRSMTDGEQTDMHERERERERPRTQADISQIACFRVLSSSQSTIPPISCSFSEPFGFETIQQPVVAQDPVQICKKIVSSSKPEGKMKKANREEVE